VSKSRRCDARCHNAKRGACSCWCGGLFHGADGKRAREAFREAWGEIPETEFGGEPLFAGTKWTRALELASKARSCRS